MIKKVTLASIVLITFLLGVSVGYFLNKFYIPESESPVNTIQPLKYIPKKTIISSEIQVPQGYKIPTLSGSLNAIYYLSIAMKGGVLDENAEMPSYPYFRALLYDTWIDFPGRDEFISCIKDPKFSIDSSKTVLDPIWRKACSEKIPDNLLFSKGNLDLIERLRVNLMYSAFRKKDATKCNDLLKIRIQGTEGPEEIDEFKYMVACQAAATRTSAAINSEYYRMESIINSKRCDMYRDSGLKDMCTKFLSTK